MIEKKFIIPNFEGNDSPYYYLKAKHKFVELNLETMNEIIELNKNGSIKDLNIKLEFEDPDYFNKEWQLWPRAVEIHGIMVTLLVRDALTTEYDLFAKLTKKIKTRDSDKLDLLIEAWKKKYEVIASSLGHNVISVEAWKKRYKVTLDYPNVLLDTIFEYILFGSTSIERKRALAKDLQDSYYFHKFSFFSVNGFFVFNPQYKSSDCGLREDSIDFWRDDVASFIVIHTKPFKIYMTHRNDIDQLSKSSYEKLLQDKATVNDLPIEVVTRCILKEYYFYEATSWFYKKKERTSLSKLSLESDGNYELGYDDNGKYSIKK